MSLHRSPLTHPANYQDILKQARAEIDQKINKINDAFEAALLHRDELAAYQELWNSVSLLVDAIDAERAYPYIDSISTLQERFSVLSDWQHSPLLKSLCGIYSSLLKQKLMLRDLSSKPFYDYFREKKIHSREKISELVAQRVKETSSSETSSKVSQLRKAATDQLGARRAQIEAVIQSQAVTLASRQKEGFTATIEGLTQQRDSLLAEYSAFYDEKVLDQLEYAVDVYNGRVRRYQQPPKEIPEKYYNRILKSYGTIVEFLSRARKLQARLSDFKAQIQKEIAAITNIKTNRLQDIYSQHLLQEDKLSTYFSLIKSIDAKIIELNENKHKFAPTIQQLRAELSDLEKILADGVQIPEGTYTDFVKLVSQFYAEYAQVFSSETCPFRPAVEYCHANNDDNNVFAGAIQTLKENIEVNPESSESIFALFVIVDADIVPELKNAYVAAIQTKLLRIVATVTATIQGLEALANNDLNDLIAARASCIQTFMTIQHETFRRVITHELEDVESRLTRLLPADVAVHDKESKLAAIAQKLEPSPPRQSYHKPGLVMRNFHVIMGATLALAMAGGMAGAAAGAEIGGVVAAASAGFTLGLSVPICVVLGIIVGALVGFVASLCVAKASELCCGVSENEDDVVAVTAPKFTKDDRKNSTALAFRQVGGSVPVRPNTKVSPAAPSPSRNDDAKIVIPGMPYQLRHRGQNNGSSANGSLPGAYKPSVEETMSPDAIFGDQQAKLPPLDRKVKVQ